MKKYFVYLFFMWKLWLYWFLFTIHAVEGQYCKNNATQTPQRLTDKQSLLAGDVVTFRMNIGLQQHGYIIPKVVGNSLSDECSIISMSASNGDVRNAQFMVVPIAVIDEETISQDIRDQGELYSKPRLVSTVNLVHVNSGRVLGLTNCKNPDQSGANLKCVKNKPVLLPSKFTYPCLSVIADFETVWDVDSHEVPEQAYNRQVQNSTGVNLAPNTGARLLDEQPLVMQSNPSTYAPFNLQEKKETDETNVEDIFAKPCKLNLASYRGNAVWLREFLQSSDGEETLRKYRVCLESAHSFTNLESLTGLNVYTKNDTNATTTSTSMWDDVMEQRQWRSEYTVKQEQFLSLVKTTQQKFLGVDCDACQKYIMTEQHQEIFEQMELTKEDQKAMLLFVTEKQLSRQDADVLQFLGAQQFKKGYKVVKTMQFQEEDQVNLNGIPVVPVSTAPVASSPITSALGGLNQGEPLMALFDQHGLGVLQSGISETPLGGLMKGEATTMDALSQGNQEWGASQQRAMADKPVGQGQFQESYIYQSSRVPEPDVSVPPVIVMPNSTAFVTIKSRPQGYGPSVLQVPCTSVITAEELSQATSAPMKPVSTFQTPEQEQQIGKVQTKIFQIFKSDDVPSRAEGSLQPHNIKMWDGNDSQGDTIEPSMFPSSAFKKETKFQKPRKMHTFQAGGGSCTLRVLRQDGEPVVECVASSPCATPTVLETNALWAIARVPFNDVPTSSLFLSESLNGVVYGMDDAKVDVYPFFMGQQSLRNLTPLAQFMTAKVAKRLVSSFSFSWSIELRPYVATVFSIPNLLSEPIEGVQNAMLQAITGQQQQVFPAFPDINPIAGLEGPLAAPLLRVEVPINLRGVHVVTESNEVVISYSLSAPAYTHQIGRQIGHFGRTSVPFTAEIARSVRVPAGVFGKGDAHLVDQQYRAPGVYEMADLFSTEYLVNTQ